MEHSVGWEINSVTSTVKPTRCINISNLYYWSNTLHVSVNFSVRHQEFKTVHTATGMCQTDTADCLLAGKRRYCRPLDSGNEFHLVPASKQSAVSVSDVCLLQYVQF